MKHKFLIVAATFFTLLLAGCGTTIAPVKTPAPTPNQSPINKVNIGYMIGYSYTYPKNWNITPTLVATQFLKTQVALNYASVIKVKVQLFPSYLDSNDNSSGNVLPVSAAQALITAGVDEFAKSVNLIANNSPTSITVLQNPGLYYTLSKNGAPAGIIGLGFSNGYEVTLQCTWSASYATIGEQACPAMLGSFATSTGPTTNSF